MKQIQNYNIKENLLMCLFAIVATSIGYIYTSNTSIVPVIYPIAGISIAVFSMYRFKALTGLFSGILLSTLFWRIMIFDESTFEIILISVALTFILFIQILFFRYTMDKTGTYGKITPLTILIYTIITIITSVIGAALASTTLSIVYGFDQFEVFITRWYVADISGMLIFGTTVLSSYYFDEEWFRQKNIYSAFGLIALYIALSIIIFSSPFGETDIHQFYFVFMMMFFVAAFLYCYRMILLFTIIYILSYRILYVGSSELNFQMIVLDLNMYLFTITMIAQVLRMILYNLEEKNSILMETNEKLEKLISSTNQMISIPLVRGIEVESNLDYVKRVFQIALSLYDNYELASCYIKIDDKPYFVDAFGYDLKMINSIDFSNHFHWALQKPEHIVKPENDLKERLGNSYSKYNSAIPELKESIRFGIYIDEQNCGGMSFDISKSSPKTFVKADFDNFYSFQKLMNNLYEINYLNNKNINLKNDIVLSLIKTLELYDNYTGGHSQEVAILSKKVAVEMNLSEQSIYNVYWAGIVHDIGKIGVRYEILNKQGSLTESEYEAVKQHPLYGSQILYQSEDLQLIADIVKHHHEKWDGTGYPNGLQGNDIPFGAQILCISDAVSAMHGKRSYADTKSSSEIISELIACSGKDFNPQLVPIMVRIIKQGALDTLQDEME